MDSPFSYIMMNCDTYSVSRDDNKVATVTEGVGTSWKKYCRRLVGTTIVVMLSAHLGSRLRNRCLADAEAKGQTGGGDVAVFMTESRWQMDLL